MNPIENIPRYIDQYLPGFEPIGENMDAKINKILKKEENAVKQTKQLLKMDKKQDKKVSRLEKMKKGKC